MYANNNKYGIYTMYLGIWILIKGVHKKCNNNENTHVDNNKRVHHQEIW